MRQTPYGKVALDVHATIYPVPGINPTNNFVTRDNRSVPIRDGGHPIAELLDLG
jgi:hypothetical protein